MEAYEQMGKTESLWGQGSPWDVIVEQTLPRRYAPLACTDGRVRIIVRQADLKDGNVWAFYVTPKYVRYLTYDRMPKEIRELLAMLVAETRDVPSNTPVVVGVDEYPPPPPEGAGYKTSIDTYSMYVSQEAFAFLRDITASQRLDGK